MHQRACVMNILRYKEATRYVTNKHNIGSRHWNRGLEPDRLPTNKHNHTVVGPGWGADPLP